MKKSERYQLAMIAVIESNLLDATSKLEILETLISDKATAEYVEKAEEEKNA